MDLNVKDYNCVAVVTSSTYNSNGIMFEYTQSRHRPALYSSLMAVQFSLGLCPDIPSFCFMDKYTEQTCAILLPHWADGGHK